MNTPYYFGMTVDDVALKHWSTPDNLEKILDFFRNEGIRATFFVVPIDEESDTPFFKFDERYLPLIQQASKDGFRFGQHGLRHNRFELGIPPAFVLNLPHEIENKRWVEKNRDILLSELTVKLCRERIRQGRKLLEDAFGFPVLSFRAPALQESPAMFAALKEEGFLADSSCLLQETAYDYYLDRMDTVPQEITRKRWEDIHRKGHGLTFPLTCDYTWDLHDNHYDKMMDLAKHDFRQCLENDIPFVTVCHVNPVFDGEGIRFLHEFYQFAKETTEAAERELQFKTLEELAQTLM